LIGFFLTTVAGGLLTKWWQARDSDNQRSYLQHQRALDKAYAIIDQTAKEVAVTIAAADDVLQAYYGEELRRKEIVERWENWARTSRNWRVNSQVLSEQIAITFSNEEIDGIFRQIVQKRRILGNDIVNLPRRTKVVKSERPLPDQLGDANRVKLEIVELLHKCGARMNGLVKQGKVE